jgi:Icc-related predicted phosphoesterase
VTGKLRLYFATDLHGSEKCFRKFVNAGEAYGASVMVLGGDVAGKAIQGIDRTPGGRYRCTFRGTVYELEEGREVEALERLIADHGYYPYRAEPGELQARQEEGSLDDLFLELMRGRLERWLALADERLRPAGRELFLMLGNDDPPELAGILDRAPWGSQAEGKVLEIDGHEIASWGYSNVTPWRTYREMTEGELDRSLRDLCAALRSPDRAILNLHPPPYDTGLDEAPVIDEEFRIQTSAGQAKFAPVGSTAVRRLLEELQPLLGLHGHIHESAGFRRLGRTLAVNPGSDYGTGALNGVLITLDRGGIKAHQLVRG